MFSPVIAADWNNTEKTKVCWKMYIYFPVISWLTIKIYIFFFCALLVHPLVIMAGLGHASVFDQDLDGLTYVGVSF